MSLTYQGLYECWADFFFPPDISSDKKMTHVDITESDIWFDISHAKCHPLWCLTHWYSEAMPNIKDVDIQLGY